MPRMGAMGPRGNLSIKALYRARLEGAEAGLINSEIMKYSSFVNSTFAFWKSVSYIVCSPDQA